MTKNMPGSRRKRRSKLLRQLINQEVTLVVGQYSPDGQFEQIFEDRGVLNYSPEDQHRDGYAFYHNMNSPMTIFIREIDRIDAKNKLIKCVAGNR